MLTLCLPLNNVSVFLQVQVLKRLKHPNVLNFMGLLLDKDNQMCFLVGKWLTFSLIRLRTRLFRIHRRWNIEEYHSRSNHSTDVVTTLALRQRHRCRHGQCTSIPTGWSLDFFRRSIFIRAASSIEIWTVPIVWSNPMDAWWSLISVSLESIWKTMKMFRERTTRVLHCVAIREVRVQRSHRMATSWLFDRKPVDRYFVIDKGFYSSTVSSRHRHPSSFRYTVVGSPYWVRTIDWLLADAFIARRLSRWHLRCSKVNAMMNVSTSSRLVSCSAR